MPREAKMISVIVSVYNTAPYLRKCIDSILNQSYKDFELIIVDDGSTDESYDIAKSYSDNRIKVFKKENGGLSSARNKGLKLAKENYAMFVDSNDCLAPNCLEQMLYVAQMNQADVVQCKLNFFKTDAEIEENSKKFVELDKHVSKKRYCTPQEKFELYQSNSEETVQQCNKLFKRSVLWNDMYPIGLLHEDEYVLYEELYRAKKIVTIDAKLYNYRVNRIDSITNRITYNNLFGMMEARKHRLEQIEKNRDTTDFYKFTVVTTLNEFMHLYWELNVPLNNQQYYVFINAHNLYKQNKSLLTLKEKIKYSFFFKFPNLAGTLQDLKF